LRDAADCRHRHRYRHRQDRVLALEGAYHGDTIGGMSVGERSVFNGERDERITVLGLDLRGMLWIGRSS
jgi:adenosylmethionine-8-amino-7-oxononanoate aminotransferase